MAASLARFSSIAAVCGAILGGVENAKAVTLYWDADASAGLNALNGTGLGGTGSWDNLLLNWWNGLSADVLWPNTTADTAIFAGTPGIVTLGTPITANALRFDVGGYNLSTSNGNVLLLGGVLSSITVTNSGDLATIDAPLALTSSALFGGAGDLKVNTIISGTGFGFTKIGAGTVTLTNANTFTGPVFLNAGTLVATNSNTALGTGSALTLRGGELKLANATGLTMTNATTVTGPAQITTDTVGGTAGITHTLGSLTIGGQTLTVSGGSTVMTGTQGLTFGGTALTQNATIAVNNSTAVGSTSTTLLTLGAITNNSFTTTFTGNGNVAQSVAAVAGVGGLTYSGTGTLSLNLANAFTGALTVNSGTVVGTSVVGALGAGNVILKGGNLQLTNASGTNLNFARPTFVTGAATITSDITGTGAGNTYTLSTLEIGGQTLTIKPGSTIDTAGNAGVTFGVATFTGNSTFDVQTPVGAVGTTTLTLGGLNDAGTARAITFQNSTAGPVASRVTLGTVTTSLLDGSSVTLAGTGSGVNLTLATVATGLGGMARLSVNGNSTLSLGVAALTYQLASLSGTGTVTATAASTLTIGNSNSTAPDTTFSGQIVAGMGLTLIKSGRNTLTLDGALSNTTTGVTSVNTGTLVLSKMDAGNNPVALSGTGLTIGVAAATTAGKATVRLGASNQITSGGTLIMNAGSTLDLNGFTQQFGTFATMFGSTISGGAGSTLSLGGGTSTLTATGANTISADTLWGGGTRTLGVSGVADSLTISGKIGNDATALAKIGSGTLFLTGDNSYTGATTFGPTTFGIINMQHGNALGAISSGTTVASGGTLQIQGSITTAAESLTLAGTGFGGSVGLNVQNGALVNVSGTNNFAGPVTLSAAATISSDAGTLNLTSATPVAGGATALTLTGPGDGKISSGIGNTLTGGVNKTGTGTWILSGASASSGVTTVTAGTLQLGDGLTNATWGATGPALTFNGAGRFHLQGAGVTAQTLGALTFTAGDGVVQSSYSLGGSAALTFTSLAARAAGATGNFVVSGGSNGDTNKIVLTGQTANTFLNQGLFFGGDAYVWYDTTGYVRGLRYSGTPDIGAVTTAGGTSLANATHQQITGAVTAQDNVTFTTLNIAGNQSMVLNANQAITVNGLLKTGNTAGGATISGGSGSGIKAASGAELVIRTNGADDLLTIAVPILANGASSLTKSGAGTLLLSAANTYTGATNVDGGTLMLGAGGTLTTSGLTVRTGGVLDLNGQTVTNGVSLSGTGAGVVAIGALTNSNTTTTAQIGAITLTSTASVGGAGNIISTGALTGTPLLVKIGEGTLTVGDITSGRSGSTRIDAGMIKISNTVGGLSAVSGTVTLNGGSLQLATTASVVAHPVAVLKDAAIIADAFASTASLTHTMGALAIGTNKLTISAGANLTSTAGLAFSGTTLLGDPTFDVQNGTGAVTTFTPAGLNDLGTARTITFQNSSALNTQSKVTLAAINVSLMDGTAVNILGGTTSGGVNVTQSLVTALGTMARVTVNGNSVLTLSVAGTFQYASLAGSGTVTSTLATPLTIGNSNSTAPDTEFSGVLSNGNGTLTLTKSGTNTLTLSGATSNSTTGITSVNTGTLVLNKTPGTNVFALTGTGLTIGAAAATTAGNATVRYGASNQMPDTTALILNAGSTLDLNGFNQKFGTFATMAGATISGSGSLLTLTGSAITTVTGVNLISANVLGGGSGRTFSTTGISDSLTISGNIGNDATTITKAGAGTLVLSGTNTYTGLTTISAGTLKLGSAGALYSGTTGALTLTAGTLDLGGYAFNNITTFTGTAGIVTSSAPGGSLTASAIATANAAVFNGTLSVNLTLASGGAASSITGNFGNTGNVTLNNASTVLLGIGAATSFLNNIGNVAFNANGTGGITVAASSNLNPVGAITNSGNGGAGSGTTLISGIIGANVTGVIQNSPNSALSLGGLNVFTTGVKIVNGQVNAMVATTPLGSGTVTLGDAATASTGATLSAGIATTYANPITTVANTNGGALTIQDGGAFIVNLTGAITQNSPLTIRNTGIAAFTLSGGITSTSGTGNDLTISANGSTIAGTINLTTLPLNHAGKITNNGSGLGPVLISSAIGSSVTDVVQSSAGSQLTLSGANAFAGGVAIRRGTVSATTNATALGSGTVTLGDATFGTGATLLGSGLNFVNPIALASGNTGTLTVGNSATGAIFSGGITGSNALTIQNSAATTATLTIQGPDLAVGGPITVIGTATTGTTTISSNITSANTVGVLHNSTHVLVLSGGNTYSGTTTLALAGTLQGASTAFSATPLSPFGTSSLVLNGGGTLQLRSPGVTGSGSVGTTTAETVTFGNNVTVGANVTVNVDRSAGFTASTNKTIALGTLTIGGQTLTITGNNTAVTGTFYRASFGATTVSGAATFSPSTAPITLASLTLSDSVAATSTTVITLGGVLAATTTNFINGLLSDNAADPTKRLSLTKSGVSAWALSGANTYTGGTSFTGGTLAGSTTAFSATGSPFGPGDLLASGGATLQLRSPGATGSGTVGTSTAETVTFGNNLAVTGNLVIDTNVTTGFTVSANKTIALGTLAIGGQVLTISGGNGYGVAFGATTSSGPTTFTANVALSLASLTLADTVTTGTTTITLGGVLPTGASPISAISGVISNNAADPSKVLGLTKAGTGTWALLGANTFTGPVSVTAGRLQYNNAGGTPGTTPGSFGLGTDPIAVSAGATLEFVGNTSQTLVRALTLPTSTTGFGILGSGTNGAVLTFPYALNAAAPMTIGGTGATVFQGAVTLTGALTKNGTGTVTFEEPVRAASFGITAGKIALTKNAIISPGTGLVQISNGAILDIGGSTGTMPSAWILGSPNAGTTPATPGYVIDSVGGGSIFVSGGNFVIEAGEFAASLAGGGNLYKDYFGVATISGNNPTFTGGLTMEEDTVIFDYTARNGEKIGDGNGRGTGSGGINIAQYQSIVAPLVSFHGNASAPTYENIGNIVIGNPSNGTIELLHGGNQTLTLDFEYLLRRNAVFNGALDFSYSANSTYKTLATNHADSIFAGWVTANGTRFATVENGILKEALTAVKNDVTTWQANENVSDSTGYTGTRGSLSINSLAFTAGGPSTVTLAPGAVLNISSGGILTAATAQGILQGGSITVGASHELILNQLNMTADLVINSDIGGMLGISKTGFGTVVLGGHNTFTGRTIVNGGAIKLTGNQSLGRNTVVSLHSVGNTGAKLDVASGAHTIGGLSAPTAFAVVNIESNASLTLNMVAENLTDASPLTGAGTLIKTGNATLFFAGVSPNFTGLFQINAGEVLLQSSGALTGPTGGTAFPSFLLNGPTAGLTSVQSGATTVTINRLGDSSPITLNNTNGGTGLRVQDTNASTTVNAEVVGVVTIGAGHNTISVEGLTDGQTYLPRLTASSLVQLNKATLLVRGDNLGATTGSHGTVTFGSALASTLAGGTGGPGTTTIGILPYVIVNSDNGTSANASLATYDATNGVRGLVNSEHLTDATGYALAGPTDNVRFASSPMQALAAGNRTVNALVLDTLVESVTVTGAPPDVLTVSSGTILHTSGGPATQATLGGFASIETTGGRDYTIFATTQANPFTISSALTSPVALVKSGSGTLLLPNPTNSYSGGTWFNQGFIEISTLASLSTGPLNFFGGGLRMAAGSSFDLSTRTHTFSTGGGTLDTNGNDVTMAGALGGNGAGGFTKAGNGVLTLNAPVNYSGVTVVTGGALKYGVATALPSTMEVELRGGATLDTAAFGGTLRAIRTTGDATINGSAALTVTEEFVRSGLGTLTLNTQITSAGYTGLTGGTLRYGVANALAPTTILELGTAILDIGNFATTLAGLQLAGDGTLNGSASLNVTGDVVIIGGALATGTPHTLTINNTGLTTFSGANFRLVDTGVNNAPLTFAGPGDVAILGVIADDIASGGVTMNGLGNLILSGASTYAGITTVNSGTVTVDGSIAGPVSVTGGTLEVHGTLTGVVTVTGGTIHGLAVLTVGDSVGTADTTFSAGTNSLGTITTTGALSLSSDVQFRFEFNSSNGMADLVTAKGITLAPGSTFAAFDLAAVSVELPLSTSFTVFNNTDSGQISGVFANLAEGSLFNVGPNYFLASYHGGDGNDLVLTTAIPEPGTGVGLAAGATALLGLRRLRRRRTSPAAARLITVD